MEISIFEVVGPMMVGPSSSHTAGAARLARVAGMIAAKPFGHVSFGLHGSFAKTYRGHGTDKALVGGAMGLREDDERLSKAFDIAAEHGLTYDFYETELDGMHENSVRMDFSLTDGTSCEVTGSSVGGAQIVIRRINGFSTEFSAFLPTLIIMQNDKKGIVSEVSGVLAANDINIGVMKLSRRARGDVACCVIETDGAIPDSVVKEIGALPNILAVQAVNIGH